MFVIPPNRGRTYDTPHLDRGRTQNLNRDSLSHLSASMCKRLQITYASMSQMMSNIHPVVRWTADKNLAIHSLSPIACCILIVPNCLLYTDCECPYFRTSPFGRDYKYMGVWGSLEMYIIQWKKSNSCLMYSLVLDTSPKFRNSLFQLWDCPWSVVFLCVYIKFKTMEVLCDLMEHVSISYKTSLSQRICNTTSNMLSYWHGFCNT